ncbi:hypothetical protein [Lapillicoccus sp.]|uniref:hypothetical protein n=1 Tax=Lapillicoccus sp. TaxID=1909287 RepID=UPI0027CEDA99|nr:hypothetical protein [Actinomycetota bacterium]
MHTALGDSSAAPHPPRASDADLLDDSDSAEATHLMMRVVGFAETVLLIPRAGEAGADVETFNTALTGLARIGVARSVAPLSDPTDAASLARASRRVLGALEESPVPQVEWAPLSRILGDDELAGLVEISTSSLTRYRAGERTTPDLVAARLHVVALIVSDLIGSYNDFGVRRWFQRPRKALDGKSPKQALSRGWAPDDRDVGRVRDLARMLLGATLG